MIKRTARVLVALMLLALAQFGDFGVAACGRAAGASLTEAGREVPELNEDVLGVVRDIESRYHDHPGYRHFFWDFMATGEYDLDFLRKYALHYYEHVRVFRLYLAGAMTVVPVEEFQVILSEVIADEFGVRLYGEPDVDGHPELFRRFMRSLGLTENDWEAVSTGKNLLGGVKHYKDVHYGLFRAGLAEETVGAIIFGMERTTPHRHSRVLDGLKKFSARTGHEIDWQFFSEHVGVDDYHNQALLHPLQQWFQDPVRVDRMRQGATASFDARKGFLDDLAKAMGVIEGPTACDGDEEDDLVMDVRWLPVADLHQHELVDETRRDLLLAYINTTVQQGNNTATVAAITVSPDLVVIDGHHRLAALAALGYDEVPCCIINYDSSLINVAGATKSELHEYALTGKTQKKLMPSKATIHTVVDSDGQQRPVETLSPIVALSRGQM